MRSAFTGAFAPYICGLIEKKQALGYDYHGSACILRTFDEFCREQFPNETCLTAELAMKWAEQFKTEKNLSRLNRVSVIRELAKYMNSVGEQAYLLPLQLTKKSGRHIPYIYSKEDSYGFIGKKIVNPVIGYVADFFMILFDFGISVGYYNIVLSQTMDLLGSFLKKTVEELSSWQWVLIV